MLTMAEDRMVKRGMAEARSVKVVGLFSHSVNGSLLRFVSPGVAPRRFIQRRASRPRGTLGACAKIQG